MDDLSEILPDLTEPQQRVLDVAIRYWISHERTDTPRHQSSSPLPRRRSRRRAPVGRAEPSRIQRPERPQCGGRLDETLARSAGGAELLSLWPAGSDGRLRDRRTADRPPWSPRHRRPAGPQRHRQASNHPARSPAKSCVRPPARPTRFARASSSTRSPTTSRPQANPRSATASSRRSQARAANSVSASRSSASVRRSSTRT